MTRIIVLFNLKPGVDRNHYEHWARTTDLPTVRQLPSVDDFAALRVTGMLGSDAESPYQYVEVIDVADMQAFGEDVSGDTMQRVAAEFQRFADAPLFLLTEAL